MLIIAHRGASAYEPQNTVKAFKKAMDMGSLYMETDVQETKDGVLILAHDYTVNGAIIKESFFNALKLPRLTEVLDILKLTTVINIEIKNDGNIYPEIEKKLLNTLNNYGRDFGQRVLISSFDYATVRRLRALDNEIKLGLATRVFNIEEVRAVNASFISIKHTRITPEIIKTCRKNNVEVFIYTVNDYQEALRLKEMGIDGIFSDYPDLMERGR
jgi:glycerophosphoryl diester phosphodiesterase